MEADFPPAPHLFKLHQDTSLVLIKVLQTAGSAQLRAGTGLRGEWLALSPKHHLIKVWPVRAHVTCLVIVQNKVWAYKRLHVETSSLHQWNHYHVEKGILQQLNSTSTHSAWAISHVPPLFTTCPFSAQMFVLSEGTKGTWNLKFLSLNYLRVVLNFTCAHMCAL